MKRIIKATLLLLAIQLPATAFAYDFEIDGIYYNINDNEATVTYRGTFGNEYNEYTGYVTIPSSVTHDGKTFPVTTLGESAFSQCTGLICINIPNSIKEISHHALTECSGLTSINIPNSVETIGNSAFEGCCGLTSITIGNSVTFIGNGAFSGCKKLTSINIPKSVIKIDSHAFSDCKELSNITVESDNPIYDSRNNCNAIIESIDNVLIAGCKNTTIPKSVTSIGNGAFFGCSKLTSINIPNTVINIGMTAFAGCSALTSINIPNSVISISSNAFEECTGLTNITIPNTVTDIGSGAFVRCSGLANIDIPNSVTTIGSFAFDGTAWFNNQPDGLVYAGLVVYKYKGTMLDGTIITLREGTLGIAGHSFSNCYGLRSIPLPNSITNIGDYAFSDCIGLTNINIPNTVTFIGNAAFSGCSELISISVGSDNPAYDSRNNCNAIIETTTNTLITGCQNTIIPKTVTAIDNNAFKGCSGLTSINIPDNITSIGNNAFSGCIGLTGVNIPKSITFIGNSAFNGCWNLTSIDIPNSVSTIGSWAFSDCTRLVDAYSYLTDLSKVLTGSNIFHLFQGDYSGRTLHVPYGTLAAYQADSKWSQYFETIVEIERNFEVDGIFYRIVGNNDSVIIIPNPSSNQYSGDISIPASVTYLDKTYSVSAIGEQAFANCPELTSIIIPSSIISVGKQAFMNDAALETVICKATTPPTWDGLDMFTTNVYNHTPLYVPRDCARAYMSDQCWGQFDKIVCPGDMNMDGTLTISDVSILINSLLSGSSTSPAADTDGDSKVTISDVTTLINLLLNSY